MTPVLRPYQHRAIGELRKAYATGRRAPLLQAPCGAGKTVMFAEIARGAMEKGNRVLILVHRAELLTQAGHKLISAGVSRGYIMAGERPDYSHLVQVASVQTLIRRLDQVPEPRLIVIDEAHHASAASWKRIFAHWPKALRLGVTATPRRTDGKGLNEFFDHLVLGPSVRELQAEGYLSPARYYAPAMIDVDGLRTVAGDYERGELAERASVITGDAVKHYQRLAGGKRAVAFCVSIEHSKDVVRQFCEAGITAEHVDGETPEDDRCAAMARFAAGTTLVIVNCELFSEGVDVPAIEAVILLRPTQSLGLHIQQVGRALRPAPGKDYAVVLDHAGNCLRHGLAETDRQWSLEGSPKKQRGEVLPPAGRCKSCFAMWLGSGRTCPQCGAVRELTPREVEHQAGELKEIERQEFEQQARERRMEQGAAKTLAELVEIGKARGYRYPHQWAKKLLAGRRSA